MSDFLISILLLFLLFGAIEIDINKAKNGDNIKYKISIDL